MEWEREGKVGEVKVKQVGKEGKRHELPLRIWGRENSLVGRDTGVVERGNEPCRNFG